MFFMFCFVFGENVFFTSYVAYYVILSCGETFKLTRKVKLSEAAVQMFFKMLFLKISQYCQKNTCLGSLFKNVAGLKACIFIKKEIPTQVFSCKYCEIFKNNFFCRTLHCSLYFFEISCDDKILWKFLGANLIFFIFLLPLL